MLRGRLLDPVLVSADERAFLARLFPARFSRPFFPPVFRARCLSRRGAEDVEEETPACCVCVRARARACLRACLRVRTSLRVCVRAHVILPEVGSAPTRAHTHTS